MASPIAAVGADHTVVIEAMAFHPASLTVQQGDRITFVNKDLVPHTATSQPRFDSGVIAAGATWRVSPQAAGRYDYVCLLHPSMKAVLVVR